MNNRDVDVLVIGGGAAGSAAALQFGRIRRSALVVDTRQPRNAPAAHMHGFIGHVGLAPGEFLARSHAELQEYGVDVVSQAVTSVVDRGETGVLATLANGDTVRARRVLLATGLTDILPDIAGVEDLWGSDVIHCPWCHGWEVRDKDIAVIDTTGAGPHQALLFSQLSDRVVLISNGPTALDPRDRDRLELAGVSIEERQAVGVRRAGERVNVTFGNEESLEVDAVCIAPRFSPNVQMVADVDLPIVEHPTGLGTYLEVDPTGQTANPNVYGAGNVVDPLQQVLHAASNGSRVAMAINANLAEEDLASLASLAAVAANAKRWDDRYSGREGLTWSGNPNGSLVALVEGLGEAGRALDVGCGEGADAIWLAGSGWAVSATDVSSVAIERAGNAGREAGVEVDWRVADLAHDRSEIEPFDLVAMSYPAIPIADGSRAIAALMAAVAPGGSLIVLGHADVDPEVAAQHGFNVADYLSVDGIADVVAETFEVEVFETRDRPNPPEGTMHLRDRVLHARRPAQ